MSAELFPMIAAAPIIRIPVPKKNDEIIETPKYLLKIMFKNVYKLAHPKLIIILPKTAQISEPTFTSNDVPESIPARTPPIR